MTQRSVSIQIQVFSPNSSGNSFCHLKSLKYANIIIVVISGQRVTDNIYFLLHSFLHVLNLFGNRHVQKQKKKKLLNKEQVKGTRQSFQEIQQGLINGTRLKRGLSDICSILLPCQPQIRSWFCAIKFKNTLLH